MKRAVLIFAATCLVVSFASGQDKTSITWDNWGVPHISSDNLEELFFAQGWAQMHNHANHILKLYGTSRGKGSEYWGKKNLTDDMLIHTLGFQGLAEEWENEEDIISQRISRAFVDGLNSYAQENPSAIEEDLKKILPLTTRDLKMHSMYVVFTRFIAGGDLQRLQNWPEMGSNAMAIGPSKSASGNAMLVQNPHLPWGGEFLFFESHLMFQNKNMYGATLVGLPGIAIGFNENLGWSHTNNVIDNSDLFELQLQGKGYLMDGNEMSFKVSQKTIKVKGNNGKMEEMTFPIVRTEFGPIIKRTDSTALALKMVGLDRPNMLLQWWKMITSNNFIEFEDALKMAQIPFWNVMYADKEGNIFYLFNGLIPERSEGDWNYWSNIIKEGKSLDNWSEVHSYSDLPKVKNPVTGWLQNANDPPWTSTIPQELDAEDFPPYMSDIGMAFRPQTAAIMLKDDNSITFKELKEYKHSTHLELAHRLMDDLETAVAKSNSLEAKRGMEVFKNWDLKADKDSKGTLLFQQWAKKFGVWNPTNYEKKWDVDNPLSTPDGISNPERAVQLLAETVKEMEDKMGTLEMPWGDFYRIKYANQDLPGNGADGWLGVFRVAWPGAEDEKHMYIGGGDSWVGVIEFGETPNAEVLLSYGNATQKDSPHFGDQLKLFSDKKLRQASFTTDKVEEHAVKTLVLDNGKFREQ